MFNKKQNEITEKYRKAAENIKNKNEENKEQLKSP